jgi:hypothetical protein
VSPHARGRRVEKWLHASPRTDEAVRRAAALVKLLYKAAADSGERQVAWGLAKAEVCAVGGAAAAWLRAALAGKAPARAAAVP